MGCQMTSTKCFCNKVAWKRLIDLENNQNRHQTGIITNRQEQEDLLDFKIMGRIL